MATIQGQLGALLAVCFVCLSAHWPQPFALSVDAAAATGEISEEVARVRAVLGYRMRRASADEIFRVSEAIVTESNRAGISPALVLAVIQIESGGDKMAVSHAGALGLMQLLPNTGRAMARQYGLAWNGPETLYDPVVNVRLGVRYLERLVGRFGSMEVALAAYNWGPTEIAGRLDRGEPLPRRYTESVLSAYHGPLLRLMAGA